MNARSRAAGYTILELAVAMTVLAAGSAVLWYGLKSSARLDKLNRLHHTALLAARSDMESVRLLPKGNVHDTEYAVAGPGGEPLRLVRRVLDSARVMAIMSEIALDDKLSPIELRKPLEVKVQVLLEPGKTGSESSALGSGSDWNDDGLTDGQEDPSNGDPKGRALVTLILKLPEYKWY